VRACVCAPAGAPPSSIASRRRAQRKEGRMEAHLTNRPNSLGRRWRSTAGGDLSGGYGSGVYDETQCGTGRRSMGSSP
jgi:hypothetical protein